MNEAFENAIWDYYQGLKEKGWSAPGEGDSSSREALFWKTPAGKYGVSSIAAAWWGWQMHAVHMAEPPVQDIYIGGVKVGSGRLYGITPEQANRMAGGPMCVPKVDEHTSCPWCGARGLDFDESPQPSTYCDHSQFGGSPIRPAHYDDLTGDDCSVCGKQQFMTPSGITCQNGHGGVEPK